MLKIVIVRTLAVTEIHLGEDSVAQLNLDAPATSSSRLSSLPWSLSSACLCGHFFCRLFTQWEIVVDNLAS